MNPEQDGMEPELRDLAQRLDEAFSGTRPSPGYADKVWATISDRERSRAPQATWWRRLNARRTLVPALGAVAAMILVAGVVVNSVEQQHHTDSAAGGSKSLSTAQPAMATPSCPADAARPSPSPSRSPGATPTPAASPGGDVAAAAPSARC